MRDVFQDFSRIMAFLEQGITQCRVLVLGDVMLDKYFYGDVKRISPEAPVPVALVKRESETLGGAANVAHNLARLGCRVVLAGMVGADENGRRLARLAEAAGIDGGGLAAVTGRPTTAKTRVIGGHQQILRLDFEETGAPVAAVDRELRDNVRRAMDDGAQCVVVSDYAKGVCTPTLCRFVIKEGAARDVPVLVDPKGIDWRKYQGAFMVTPNLKELAEAAKTSVSNDDAAITRVAEKIRKRYNIANLVVTRSEKGLSLINGSREVHITAYAQEVFDVSGAGDTVAAVLAAALAGGIDAADAAHLANMAAGVVVAKLGTYAISRDELLAAVGLG